MRFAVNVNQAYIYEPSRKDRKHFAKFAQTEARLETWELLNKVYDHRLRAFVINSESPHVFEPRDNNVRLIGTENSYTSNFVSTDQLNHYNVFDCLVRLMARFNKGDEYLSIMQRAKEGDIEGPVLEQQGLPILHSEQAVEDFMRKTYTSYQIMNPEEVSEARHQQWKEQMKRWKIIK